VLQSDAVCCSALLSESSATNRCADLRSKARMRCRVLQSLVVCCSVFKPAALIAGKATNVLQSVAECLSANVLQSVAECLSIF